MSSPQSDLREIWTSLLRFLKHPVKEIRQLPDWNWRKIIWAQILVTMASGALAGVVQHSLGRIVLLTFMTPTLTLITTSISSLFFFYTFQVFTEKTIEYRAIFIAVFFANIPFFIFQIVMDYFPPILLVGLSFTALLLIVAFVENFHLSRRLITRLIAGLYIIFVITYVFAYISASHSADHWHKSSSDTMAPAVPLGNDPKAH